MLTVVATKNHTKNAQKRFKTTKNSGKKTCFLHPCLSIII